MHHFGTASSHSIRLLFSILFLLYPFGVTSLCPTHNPISQYQPGLCHEDTAEHLLLLSDLRALSTHNNHRGQGGGLCYTSLFSFSSPLRVTIPSPIPLHEYCFSNEMWLWGCGELQVEWRQRRVWEQLWDNFCHGSMSVGHQRNTHSELVTTKCDACGF